MHRRLFHFEHSRLIVRREVGGKSVVYRPDYVYYIAVEVGVKRKFKRILTCVVGKEPVAVFVSSVVDRSIAVAARIFKRYRKILAPINVEAEHFCKVVRIAVEFLPGTVAFGKLNLLARNLPVYGIRHFFGPVAQNVVLTYLIGIYRTGRRVVA